MATEGRSSDAASAPTPKVKVSVPGTEDTSVTVAAIKPVSPLLREAHGLGLRGKQHGSMCALGCIGMPVRSHVKGKQESISVCRRQGKCR